MTREDARTAAPGSAVPGGGRHARRTPDPVDQGASAAVRPYFYTRGRTRAVVELALEALVSTVPGAAVAAGPAQSAYELCREPRSVAEVAALMRVPLGVARVLVGDLVAAGSVVVHRTADAAGPDLSLMQRVLAGLRNL